MGKIHIPTPLKYALEWIKMENGNEYHPLKRSKLLAKTLTNDICKYKWIDIDQGISRSASPQEQIRVRIQQRVT